MEKLSKKITVQLDKPRTLLLNMNSMIEFENATGQDFMVFTKRLQRRAFAYACQAAPEGFKAAIAAGDTKLAQELQRMPAPIAEDLALPDLTMNEMRAMLWCLLVHEDESLTLKQVGALITSENMEAVFKAMIDAQKANSPEPVEKEAAGPLEAAPQK